MNPAGSSTEDCPIPVFLAWGMDQVLVAKTSSLEVAVIVIYKIP